MYKKALDFVMLIGKGALVTVRYSLTEIVKEGTFVVDIGGVVERVVNTEVMH